MNGGIVKELLKIALRACKLTAPHELRYYSGVNDIREKLSELQDKGWTLAAISEGIGMSISAVEKWKSGVAYPGASKPVMLALDALLKRRPPKQRRYPGTHHLQRANQERERESGDQTNRAQRSVGPDDRIRRTRRYWLSYHVPNSEGGTSLSFWRWL